MNIFFYHDEKNHSSLIGDLAWSNHNGRIEQLKSCKRMMQEVINDKNEKESNKESYKRAIKYYDKLIKICHKYKEQTAVTEEWLLNYVKQKRKVRNK